MRKKKTQVRRPKSKGELYTYQFKINHSASLLEYLYDHIHLSRNSVKGLLQGHKVLVNGSVVTQFDYPLAKDDEVKVTKNAVRSTPVKRQKTFDNTKVFKSWIIYEDDEFLAINKPNGLLSVESDKEKECAYAMAVEYLRLKDKKARPYVLHRIDKETSGVLVFAKDIKIHSMLRNHWNKDIKLREYVALVNGKMEKKEDTIVANLMENQNHLVYVSKDRQGKRSITNYEVMKENKDFSLLRVTIDTGRKNQIRVMMKYIGHAVVGDEKYEVVENPIGRLGLHASALEFIHPVTKKLIRLVAPVPEQFTQVFEGV